MQFLAAYIMKGRMQAILVATTLALLSMRLPPLSIVSSAAVALWTLRNGAKDGLTVLAGSAIASAVLSMLVLGVYQIGLSYSLVLWLPVWLIAIILRETRQMILAVEVAVLLGVAGVLGFFWYQPEPALFWHGLMGTLLQPVIAAQPEVADSVRQYIDAVSHFMTGFIATGSVFGLLFGLFLARWLQAGLYNPGGFRSEYLNLKGHMPLALASVVILAVAGLTDGLISEIAWNILVVLLVLYTFTGTAVLHCLIATSNASRYLLPLFYVTLLLIPHLMALVAFCGLLDTWLNLRNKLKPNGA